MDREEPESTSPDMLTYVIPMETYRGQKVLQKNNIKKT
jgi:hypothetical protein